MVDVTYTKDAMFTRFMAETKAGEIAWNSYAEWNDGTFTVLNYQAKSIINYLRRAGYTVAKAKPAKQNDDELLAALEA